MNLTFDEYSLWCPGRGVALAPVTGRASGLTLLVGRSGAGASLLLNSVASLFPVGAAVRGTVRPGRAGGGGLRTQGPRVALAPGPEAFAGRAVSEVVGADPDHVLLEETGLARELATATTSLTPEVAALLGVAWLVGHRDLEVAVLDQPLARLHPSHRGSVVAALRRLADRGVLVLWAEHHYEDVVGVADHVLELDPLGASVVTAAAWTPRTVPLPPHAAVARALGLPRAEWFDLAALRSRPEVIGAVPLTAPRITAPGAPLVVAGDASGLGVDLDLEPAESVALLSSAPTVTDLAAAALRLTALRRGSGTVRRTPTLPGGVRVGHLVHRWSRRNAVPTAALTRTLSGIVELDLDRRVDQHSSGERAALLTALLLNAPGASLLTWPDEGLDAGARRRLAQVLASGEHEGVVLCTRDVEFAARAAHRWVVTTEHGTTLQGPAAALAGELGVPPLLVRAGSRAVRAHDVVGEVR